MDSHFSEDTICAIATPVGEAGIGIIKISGPSSLSIVKRLFEPTRDIKHWQSHRLYHGWIKVPENGQAIDEVLVSYMRAPRSYTGEDVVEINCHSGYAILNEILELVLAQGARLAEPGEFTRRAFLNGRIDLSQAEAIGELIYSRSRQAILLATRQLKGELRKQVEHWREVLIEIEAFLAAEFDFPEESESDLLPTHLLRERLKYELIEPIRRMLHHYENRRVLREGLAIVLVGRPNVGKSSFLNALLGEERAIVSSLPGTTRDIIEESFLLRGIQIRLLDTAGIREKPDQIESMGIERTLKSVAEADLVVWLIDQSTPLSEEDDIIYRHISDKRFLILLNKADLPSVVLSSEVETRYPGAAAILSISVLNPRDIDRFRKFVEERFLRDIVIGRDSLFIPNLRQHRCLREAHRALLRACQLMENSEYPELISDELSVARKGLEDILGINPNEDLLDQIFGRFCIGK